MREGSGCINLKIRWRFIFNVSELIFNVDFPSTAMKELAESSLYIQGRSSKHLPVPPSLCLWRLGLFFPAVLVFRRATTGQDSPEAHTQPIAESFRDSLQRLRRQAFLSSDSSHPLSVVIEHPVVWVAQGP